MIVENIFLIAEIGINHNGEIKIAKELIKAASEAGFDSVKFQKRDVETVYKKEFLDSPRESPWGDTQRHQKEGIEFGQKEYQVIDDFCKSLKIEWFASAWDLNSLKFLTQFNFKYNKIASAMITNLPLLESVDAVKIFKKNKCKFVLMHSIGIYPCDEKLLNLNLIQVLKKKFKCEVGYSGHESTVAPTITAYFLGANYIERHITLDRANWGTDQAASLSEVGIEALTSLFNKIPKIMGDGRKRFLKKEKENSKKMRYW